MKHPIDVVPDHSPEAAILSPPEKSLDVRLDETIVIEVEARDPDFALSAVRLHGDAAGRPQIDVPLLEKEHTGKFTGRYRFTPREHNLQAGDVVQYWVAADDIRTPKPNSTATEKRIFRIVSPDPAQQPPPDRIAQRDQRQQPGGTARPAGSAATGTAAQGAARCRRQPRRRKRYNRNRVNPASRGGDKQQSRRAIKQQGQGGQSRRRRRVAQRSGRE